MLMIVIFLLISFYYIISDLIPMYRKKQWKVFWIYTVIITLDLIMISLTAMGIPLPSPSLPVKKIIFSIFNI